MYSESGKEGVRPITRAIGMAVIANPFAGRHVQDLSYGKGAMPRSAAAKR